MKSRVYIPVAVLSLVVFALAQLPASLVWKSVGARLSQSLPFAVDSVGGTVWKGFATGSLRFGLSNDRILLSWDIHPSSLLMARCDVDLHAESREFTLAGKLAAGLGGMQASGLKGEVRMKAFDTLLRSFGAGADGLVSVHIDDLAVGWDKTFKQAVGGLEWTGGNVTYSVTGAPETHTVPAVMAVLGMKAGAPELAVAESKSRKALGSLSLNGDGILTVVALQRVLTLVGMTASNEEQVLIKTQQPLF